MAFTKPKVVLQTSTLPLLLTFLMMLLANQLVHSQSTTFGYDCFPENPTDLLYQGDVSVTPPCSPLLLTKTDASGIPQQNSVGRVVYAPPVILSAPSKKATFETTIRFFITPSGPVAADGLTFFIAPVGTTIPNGASGSNLGIFDSSGTGKSIFAVEFDIYPNPDGFFDPSYPHIGIDINSKYSKTFTSFENALRKVVTARINYNSDTKNITVVANYGSEFAELSYEIDLKIILPQQVQVGVSASTGGYVANFQLLSWYFTATLEPDSENNNIGETYIHPYV